MRISTLFRLSSIPPRETHMFRINKVAVLGGNGTMGSLSGGIFAQANIHCIYFERTIDEAEQGIEKAVKQAKSTILREYIVPATYDDLEKELSGCDWILEALSENIDLKRYYLEKVDNFRRNGSIISTISSGLSIEELAKNRSSDFKAHFLGMHFFNPPGKLIANELVYHPDNSEKLKKNVSDFCKNVLRRVNVVARNTPGFAGNRIGFQLLNEACLHAERLGVDRTDYLIGPYTGRALPPLTTLDLVGLDVHRAIVQNIFEKTSDERHETYKMPEYLQRMIDRNMLGLKTPKNGGFYYTDEKKKRYVLEPSTLKYRKTVYVKNDVIERIKRYIHDGNYNKAVSVMKDDPSEDASIARHFILGYVSYSFFRVGEVTPEENGIHGIDRVMAYGFSWMPPSGWVDFLGGPKKTVHLIEEAHLPVPEALRNLPETKLCRVPDITRFFIAV